jgi:hypothetical protein
MYLEQGSVEGREYEERGWVWGGEGGGIGRPTEEGD